MSVFYSGQDRIFHLHTAHTSYQMMVDELGYLFHLYYGPRTEQSHTDVLVYEDRGFSGNPAEKRTERVYSLNTLPQEYPFWGAGDYRNTAFLMEDPVTHAQGADLRFSSCRILKGKRLLKMLPSARGNASDSGIDTLEIVLRDAVSGVEAVLYYSVYEAEDMITKSLVIRNTGSGTALIRRAATHCLDLTEDNWDLIHFWGRHTMERQPERTPVEHASLSIGSRRGTSSHQHNPGVILAEHSAGECAGRVYGNLLSYSGGFLCEAQKDPYGQTRLLLGISDHQFAWPLAPGEELELPECILSYAEGGFRELTHRYHDFLRKYVIRDPYEGRQRPVLINSWEAAYFDFNADTIAGLAKEAKKLGLDMVVMDDGWFGERSDDNRGLGDWQVNEKKLGCSLGELIRKVNAEGMEFGIWIEPEMINTDSELYREHPDWVMQIPGRQPVFARNQLVLDFSRAEVRNYIFDSICRVLDQGPVSYVKWDMNRSIYEVYSAENAAGTVLYRFVLGIYEFLQRLTCRYPELLIEGCSGGGGRFDAGMLSYTPQIWCSDNTDAADRVKIQYGTSFFYPVSTVGAHVSACPNHQTGRTVPLKTRSIVAMAGTYGFELDPAKLAEEEKEFLREELRVFRSLSSLIATGDYYRLSDPLKEDYAVWAIASKDKKTYLLSAVLLEGGPGTELTIFPEGLDANYSYQSSENGTIEVGAKLLEKGIKLRFDEGRYDSVRVILTAAEL